MITKWSVSNFKSIRDETSVPLAPLTIFAGSNSSGKSTILQSLLLVCQTLAHKIGSRSVVLNGTLTRLGQFDDLRSYQGEFEQITIGWECHPTENAQMALVENMRLPGTFMATGRRIGSIKEISCKLAFDTNPGSPERDLYQLQPQLFLFTMSVLARAEDKTDRRCDLTVSRSPATNTKIANLKVEEPDNEVARASLEYDILLDDDSLEDLREELMTAEPVGCVLRHFLPERLSIRVNMVEEIARWIQAALIEGVPRYYRMPLMERELVIPDALISQFQTKLGDKYGMLFETQPAPLDAAAGMPVREWMDRIRKLPMEKIRELRRTITEWPDLHDTIVKMLRSERKEGESEYQLLPYVLPRI